MKVVVVEEVQIMRGSNLLYSAPMGHDDDRLCESCGERAPRLPCPHCGRPDPNIYVRPDTLRLVVLKKRKRPRYGPEISFVFNPYLPEEK